LDQFWTWTGIGLGGDVARVLSIVSDLPRLHQPVAALVEGVVRATSRLFPLRQSSTVGTEPRQCLQCAGVSCDGTRVLFRN
jgi:hypothetical protein